MQNTGIPDSPVFPLGKRLVVVRAREKAAQESSTLLLTDTASEAPTMGIVLKVGIEVGNPMLVEAAPIVFGRYSGTEFEFNGKQFLFLNESEVIGVVTDVNIVKNLELILTKAELTEHIAGALR